MTNIEMILKMSNLCEESIEEELIKLRKKLVSEYLQ